MSRHHMNWSFDIPEYSFNGQVYQGGNASISQGPSQGRRPQDTANASSAHGFQSRRHASASEVGNYTNYNQFNVPPQMAQNVPPLLRPQLSTNRHSVSDSLTRFCNDDSPWTPEQVRQPKVSNNAFNFPQTNTDFHLFYHQAFGSEVGSNGISDSGYQSQHPQSNLSNEPDQCNQDLPDVTRQTRHLRVDSTPTKLYSGPTRNADQLSVRSHGSRASGKEYKCSQCTEVFKCPSDAKKHTFKHDKPYKCGLPNCPRDGQGFTTVNDLNRHKKSVHGIGALEKSFQCASENCRSKDKVWPRLDNFKQHIQRMHAEEDELDLIRRSEYKPPTPSPSVSMLSVAPMDTTLAGMGVEKQFTSNDFDDPGSAMSLTPDQSPNPWTSFNMTSSHKFATDVDQAEAEIFTARMGNIEMNMNLAPRQINQNQGSSFNQGSMIQNLAPTARDDVSKLSTLSVVTELQSLRRHTPQPLPLLSKEPQTKAEQQKQALQNLSRLIPLIAENIQSSSNNEPVDLGNVILQVIGGATGMEKQQVGSSAQHLMKETSVDSPSSPEPTDTITRTQAVKGLQALSNLLKQKGKKPIGVSNRPEPCSSAKNWCDRCNTSLPRACDLKKHMKRHTRPYGCTYAKCYKRFGAKSDWKRHENSQHFQLECYRCCRPCSSSSSVSSSQTTACGELFYYSETLKDHLISQHLFSEQDQQKLDAEVKASKIGKNGQGQFWCGFCTSLIKLNAKRNAAWDERFNHIDEHFKKGRSIEEWWCLEARKSKGECFREVNRSIFDDESQLDEKEDRKGEDEVDASSSSDAVIKLNEGNGRKRSASKESEQGDGKRRKRDERVIVRFCLRTPALRLLY
ncbi:hypothetical protein GQ43DRAFT_475846 [Delitschia confertaspora ATCC 74209]|uniref:C2H2-type domain-containing protein n=1 Tax=Delitschia confertaspora ATCC 74209 TaxID=1513339 RepID=A0A9P4JGW2_9PLEO|nr:hypothetical protein GQ43DRAFT_475846 [Delitschia confertaspora ATCC 74209]